jgi:hypothetical protein
MRAVLTSSTRQQPAPMCWFFFAQKLGRWAGLKRDAVWCGVVGCTALLNAALERVVLDTATL